MSSSPISRLSQELIDSIIDKLSAVSGKWDRWDSLSSCALVCHSFLPRSQMHIFCRIKIPAPRMLSFSKDRAKRCQEFYKILKRSPYIADYVREVYVTISDHDKSWIFEDPTFLAIMIQIKKSEGPLQKLCLEGRFRDHRISDTHALIKHFFQPFVSPFIISLQLCRVLNVPTDVLRSCVNLIELILFQADLKVSPTQTANEIRPRPHRLQFELDSSRARLVKIFRPASNGSLPCLDFSQLRSLIINTDYLEDLDFEQEIIDETGGSLEELTIKLGDDRKRQFLEDVDSINFAKEHYAFKSFINLQHTTRLRSLETYTEFELEHPTADGNNLSTICHILSTIPKSNSLMILRFTIYLGVISGPPDVLLDADWDLFFSEMTRLASGKRFKLSVCVKYEIDDTTDDLRDWDTALRHIIDSDSDEEEASMMHREKRDDERRKITESKAECQRVFGNLIGEKFGIVNTDSGITVVLDMAVSMHVTRRR